MARSRNRHLARHIRLWTARGGLTALGGLVFIVGCQDYRGPVSIHSNDPDLHVVAIKRDQACPNHEDLVQMVEDLNDDDPAIRFYAIQSLQRVTHDDFGYRFYEDEDQRVPSLKRWQAWMKAK